MQKIFISVLILLLIGIGGYYYLEIYLPNIYAKQMISLFDEMRSSDALTASKDIQKEMTYTDAVNIIQERQNLLLGVQQKLLSFNPPRKMAKTHQNFLELLDGFLTSNANSERKALFFKNAFDLITTTESDLTEPDNKAKTVTVAEYQEIYKKRLSEIKTFSNAMFSDGTIELKPISYENLKISWLNASLGYDELINYLDSLNKNTRLDPSQPLKVIKSANTENIGNIDEFTSLLKTAVKESDVREMVTNFLIFPVWFSMLLKIFFQESVRNSGVDIFILIAVGIVSVLLIKSFLTEVSQKEQLNWANSQLKDLSEHLQQKVDEQTKEIKKAYEVERKARIDLEELDKAKTQFILTAQHHLRTPLTILKGYAAALKEKFSNAEETKIIIAKIAESTERLGKLVNELLDISELEVTKNLHLENANIKDIVAGIIKNFQPEIDKKWLEVTFNFPAKAEDNFLTIDKEKMAKALSNIIDNAVKYNKDKGRINIHLKKITHPIEKTSKLMQVRIENTGIGITATDLPKLFTHYFQRGEEAQKIYTTGRGIGLAAAKSIIQAHQGNIWAESEGEGTGARFIVEIPG